ncbi:unnamed protein product [Phytomonas sp. EM1]|nr:unnamed protein product [Phytomonas sp. EM1]|eukprot:CCW61242.1 unnamed protein product [Phytomonas sp. isolate EM1]
MGNSLMDLWWCCGGARDGLPSNVTDDAGYKKDNFCTGEKSSGDGQSVIWIHSAGFMISFSKYRIIPCVDTVHTFIIVFYPCLKFGSIRLYFGCVDIHVITVCFFDVKTVNYISFLKLWILCIICHLLFFSCCCFRICSNNIDSSKVNTHFEPCISKIV